MSMPNNPTLLSDDFYQTICKRVSSRILDQEHERGNSGSYIVYNDQGKFLAIIKPASEEPLAPRNKRLKQRIKRWFAKHFRFTALQTQSGQGVYAEAAAYTIGAWVRDTLDPQLPDIVPYTVMIQSFPIPNPDDKDQPFSERVSLQCGANLPLNGAELAKDQPFQSIIAAEKLLHTTNHYRKKWYPPLLKRLWNVLRKRVGLEPLQAKGTPWKDATGHYLEEAQFQQGQSILHATLKDQFALMSLHNYLINDVDKHGKNWLIVGDYPAFITAVSEERYAEAEEIAKTLRISSIDNGAAFAPKQQNRADWFQVRNRLQYYRLEMARLAQFSPELVGKLWLDRATFAQHIWDHYHNSEADCITLDRVRAALERLAAVYEFSKSNLCVASMCNTIKYRTQIEQYAQAYQKDIDTTLQQLDRKLHSVESETFINNIFTARQQTGKSITFHYVPSNSGDEEDEDAGVIHVPNSSCKRENICCIL